MVGLLVLPAFVGALWGAEPGSPGQGRMPPGESPFPVFPPVSHLVVVPVPPTANTSARLTLLSLQGLANRQGAGVYLDFADERSDPSSVLSFVVAHYALTKEVIDVGAALDRYLPGRAGLVVYDPARPESVNVATTVAAKRFCREALTLQRRLFRLWHRFRGDPRTRGAPLTRDQLIAKVLPIDKRFFALAERHVNAADAEVSNLARALFQHHPHFFTFVHEEGVEPTNNVAERALRTAVQWRKIMFGNRSAEGERAVARLLTATRTCQLQQLNVLAYLTAAIYGYRRRQAVASLLPRG